MRLIETQSKWGNLFRSRFYMNGKRCTGLEFERALLAAHKGKAGVKYKLERPSFSVFRHVWQAA